VIFVVPDTAGFYARPLAFADNPYLRLVSRNRDFRRLYLAQLVSFGGDWFLVVPLLGLVYEMTHSKLATAAVWASQLLPNLLLSPLAGAVSDRFDRKRVMIASDLLRAAACVGLVLVDDLGSPALAYALGAVIGIGTAFFYPNPSAALPNLVAKDDLGPANVLLGSAWGTMAAAGAALGGTFAAILGRDASFLVDGASFVASAGLILSLRARLSEGRASRPPPVMRSAGETLRYARERPEVLALLTSKAGFGITSGAIVLLPAFAADVFDAGDAGTGWLFAARGAGALAGPFLFRRVFGATDRTLMRSIWIAVALWGACYVGLPFSSAIPLAALAVAVAHLGGGAQWMLSSYGLQRTTPDAIRGRIFSADLALVTGTSVASFAICGALADAFGVRAVLAGAGLFGVAFSVAWGRATARFWESPSFDGRP
jgi:MFS family permease